MLCKRDDTSRGSVLIVDQSEDSREVLRTVLQRRGMETYEASRAEQGLQLAQQHRPGVIVLDLEAVPADDERIWDGFDAERRKNNTPMVILGNARRYGVSILNGQLVTKPYHFGPLIRKIEELLGYGQESVDRSLRRSAAGGLVDLSR